MLNLINDLEEKIEQVLGLLDGFKFVCLNTSIKLHNGIVRIWNVNTKLNRTFKVFKHLITCIQQVINNLMIHELEYY